MRRTASKRGKSSPGSTKDGETDVTIMVMMKHVVGQKQCSALHCILHVVVTIGKMLDAEQVNNMQK